jgi:two-component system chemotaxis response regulator CheV
MGNVLEGVERQIRLAGHNRMAMLLFSVQDGGARCALNVFKVREVLRCPPITPLLGQNAYMAGSVDYRGKTIPAIDLALALGLPALAGSAQAHLVVTEFSRSIQAFIVGAVDRIVHVDVATVEPPREGMVGPRINATTRVDGALVMIVDVEQILSDVSGVAQALSPALHGAASQSGRARRQLLIVDDSLVARRNMEEIAKRLGLAYTLAQDGVQALEILRSVAGGDGEGLPSLVISDIEMPRLDGYALTRAIREDPALARLRVLLHSSLSGGFNAETVASVGADRFVAKFNPDILAKAILDLLPASD